MSCSLWAGQMHALQLLTRFVACTHDDDACFAIEQISCTIDRMPHAA